LYYSKGEIYTNTSELKKCWYLCCCWGCFISFNRYTTI